MTRALAVVGVGLFLSLAAPGVGRAAEASPVATAVPLARIGQPSRIAVTTAAYDNLRSGWNRSEKILTPTVVGGRAFGLQRTVPLSAPVFGQPLVVPNVSVVGDPFPGTHDVVYLMARNNDMYAIDPVAGTVLLRRNLGLPPSTICGPGTSPGAWAPTGGPVIDPTTGTLYAMVRTAVDDVTTFQLHALDLTTLKDKVPPRTVEAMQPLTSGDALSFDANIELQRPALLLSAGVIYAGFGAACEIVGSHASGRGWVLAWRADTLAPAYTHGSASQPFALLTDRDATSLSNFFLSSIWMSGSGLAADGRGSLYFVTGNSDARNAYDGVNNMPETVVRLSEASGKVESQFTPRNFHGLDVRDEDFGAGGVTLLPGPLSDGYRLAVAAGKNGVMYLLNRDNLGGFAQKGPDQVFWEVSIGSCFCAESSFVSPGGTWVVSSGGDQVMLWRVTTLNAPKLQIMGTATVPPLLDDAGMFTTVSSNDGGDPIIWTVSAPRTDTSVWLYAFDADPPGAGHGLGPNPVVPTLKQLVAIPAGYWSGGRKSVVRPVVANGRVYVASHDALRVFGVFSSPGD